MKSLAAIKTEVHSLAQLVNASSNDLPTFGHTRDGARPHIETADGGYHYVVVERGQELERRTTQDYSELLFWIFHDVTFQLAVDYELEHRVEDQDCRRIIFPRQVELMARLGPDFARRSSEHITGTLAQSPYDDEPIRRLSRLKRGEA